MAADLPRFLIRATVAVAPLTIAQAFAAPRVEAAGPCEVGAQITAKDSKKVPLPGQRIIVVEVRSGKAIDLITNGQGVGINPETREQFARLKGQSVDFKGPDKKIYPVLPVRINHEKGIPKEANLDCRVGRELVPIDLTVDNPATPININQFVASGSGTRAEIGLLREMHNIPGLKEIGDFFDDTGTWVNKQITDLHNSDKSWMDAGKFFSDLGSRIHEHPVAAEIGDKYNWIVAPILLLALRFRRVPGRILRAIIH